MFTEDTTPSGGVECLCTYTQHVQYTNSLDSTCRPLMNVRRHQRHQRLQRLDDEYFLGQQGLVAGNLF